MKSPPTFEIKVAVIGPVSAGKSTLLNALLVGKYSEVSIRRTTAGVNFFRLNHQLNVASSKAPTDRKDHDTSSRSKRSVEASEDDTKWDIPDQLQSEDQVLQTITEDNQALRDNDCNEVSEKTFDIVLDKPLCECRSDTKLVVVDVPGINEADSNSKYRQYITNNWRTFDFVVLVMDSRQVVNTEEQVDVLEFVKKTRELKKVPVVILFNKIDDIDSLQVDSAIQEARGKVASLFGVPKDVDLVQEIVDGNLSFEKWDKSTPIFLPISARNGYVYRLAQAVKKERFKLLERELVEALGQEEMGRAAWRRVSEDKKYDAAYEAISEREVYEDGIKTSNFQKFLSILEFCVGGDATQALLIEQQLRIGMETFAFEDDFTVEVSRLYDIIKVFPHLQSSKGGIWKELQDIFWRRYRAFEKKCCRVSCESPLSSHKPVEELVKYHKFASKAGWGEQQSLSIETAISYLNRFVQTVLNSISPSIGDPNAKSSKKVLLETTRDVAKLSELLNASGLVGCRQDPFKEVRMVVEVVRQKAIVTLGNFKLKQCAVCEKLLPEGVSCHYEKCSQCMVITDNVTKCTMPSCAKYNALLTKYNHSIYSCEECEEMWQLCSSTEEVIQFDLEKGKWRAKFGVNAFDLNTPNHQASDPSHFGHGFWLFLEWMGYIDDVLDSASLRCSKRRKLDLVNH